METAEHLKDLRYVASMDILFQEPWEILEVESAVHSLINLGFDVRYKIVERFPPPTNIVRIRNQTAELSPKANVYLTLDDDMQFKPGTPKYPRSSGRRYKEAFLYMQRFRNCGAVSCAGFLGGYKIKYKIRPVWRAWYSMSRGLLLRNSANFRLLPKEWELPGGIEETAAVFVRMASGFFPAKQMNVPTVHKMERLRDDLSPHDMHNKSLIRNNLQKKIQEEYQDPTWDALEVLPAPKEIPERIRSLYIRNGGDPKVYVPWEHMRGSEEYTYDFEDYPK